MSTGAVICTLLGGLCLGVGVGLISGANTLVTILGTVAIAVGVNLIAIGHNDA